MKILSAQQLYEADQITVEKGKMDSIDLMERAATLCFQWIDNRLHGNAIPIHVFCGTGNNGGDGLVIARHLKQHGYNVFTYIVNCSNKRQKSFLTNYDRLKEIGVWAEMITCGSEIPEVSENDMIIDAIFGLGLKRPPEGVLKEVIQYINSTNSYVLSIDIPSGLYVDKPVLDREAVIRAYHTVTFQTVKLAFLLPDNQEFVPSWDVLNIGLDAEFLHNLEVDQYLLFKDDIKPIYQFRDKFSHKGDFGHTQIMGGSFGKIGAAVLASRAALTVGSGLVTAVIPNCGYQILQTAVPEVMVEVDAERELQQFKFTNKPSVIAMGIGMGTSAKTALGFEQFLKTNKEPLVLDADALNLLSKKKSLLKLLPANTILTPHLKEFERLVGAWKNDYEKLDKLKKLASKHQLIIVLKGLIRLLQTPRLCILIVQVTPP